MAGVPEGFFKDPEKDRKHFIQLVANYARNVPELLTSLRDVINYGMLYDQKLKAFLDLMNQERKRQKRVSGTEGYETDFVDHSENVSVCSADTLNGSTVKKKKKKKKRLKEPGAEEEIKIDETNIGSVKRGDEFPENTENVCPDGPPAKKKKKKKKKNDISRQAPQTRDCDLPASTIAHPSQTNGYSEVSNVAEFSSTPAPTFVDDVKPSVKVDNEVKEEVKPEAEVKQDELQKEEFPPDVTTTDESILLNTIVGDRNGTSHNPPTKAFAENTPRKTHSGGAGTYGSTPFRVIPSVRLMEDPARFPELVPRPAEPILYTTPGTSFKPQVECFSTNSFHEAFQSSGRGTSEVIDMQTPAETDELAEYSSVAQNSSLEGSPSTDHIKDTIESARLQQQLFKRLVNPSTVNWIKDSMCKPERKLFKEWLDLQKNSLPLDSSHDNGHVLFKSPQHWAREFKKWTEEERGIDEGSPSLLYSGGDMSYNRLRSDSNRNRPETPAIQMAATSRHVSPGPSIQRDDTEREGPRNASRGRHELARSSTLSDGGRESAAPQLPQVPLPLHVAYQNSLNSRITDLLDGQGVRYNHACLVPHLISSIMEKYLPVHQRPHFLNWMTRQKEKIIENPSLISTHVLFRPAVCWFREFDEQSTIRRQRSVPTPRGRGNFRCRRGKRIGTR